MNEGTRPIKANQASTIIGGCTSTITVTLQSQLKAMWLLPKNIVILLLLYLILLLLLSVPNVYSQSVVTSNKVAKEGDGEVVIPCDYSQVTNTPLSVIWNEVNETVNIITFGIVSNVEEVNGRYSLRRTPGNADLVITKPVRNDNERRFQCQILSRKGDFIYSDSSILTVNYLDEPVLSASASSVYEGESVALTCTKPDGDPEPSITWYKDGQALSTTDTNRFTTSEVALEIHIEAASAADGGRYTYLTVTFESKDGTATCTAEGHPNPSSVMIYKDGEMIENGTLTASVKIYEEICKSNITCYAENGEVNATEPLKTCKEGSNSALYALFIIPVILWILFLLYFIFCRKIEIKGEDMTAVEGDKSLAMSKKYRPSIAHFETFQWDFVIKNEEKNKEESKTQAIGLAPKLGFKYILRCCFYFCGICCIEYKEKYENGDLEKKSKNSEGKHYEELELEEKDCERGIADGEDLCGNNDPNEEEAYVNISTENINKKSQSLIFIPDRKGKTSDQRFVVFSEKYLHFGLPLP
ncbi:uncharacterized protein LOC117114695 [Anneissia japonica]|uniref:uncharacterized protein LOC117114695 n=1 Tax=Anneissia japonica TaxID=1529436 RepID=UPI0014256406|nr:uncharacterized protein LOC117114695 [Anneissia japonica]